MITLACILFAVAALFAFIAFGSKDKAATAFSTTSCALSLLALFLLQLSAVWK